MPQPELNRALRKIQRISAMHPREIAHRLREKGYAELQRFGLASDEAGLPGAKGFKNYLAASAIHRFYPGVRDANPDFVRKHFPQWIDRAVEEAERLCRHEVRLLGLGDVTLGRRIDWHRDPYSGRDWEVKFHTRYMPQDDPAGRDVKVIHELNRHQHLPRLAKAYYWTGDERYAAEAIAQMESWIVQNPVGYGINWQSSLEIAMRALSWIWTMFLLLPSRTFDEAAAERTGRSLFAQLQHVERHLSRYTSPNTHLIGETTALLIAGSVFPDHTYGAAWRQTGASSLIQEASRQILDEAVYGELSSWYHCYALDFYLQAVILADQNGHRMPGYVCRTVQGMVEFLMHLTRPDGTLPLLGDDDGGRSLALARKDYRSFNEALEIGAVLFDRRDFKFQTEEFPEEAFWLLGKEGWEAYNRLEQTEPGKALVLFPDAGYAIQRSGWGPQASHLVFDYGGLGILRGGHAHADALSLTLSAGGRELLVDPATFVYNCQPEWRTYFRSTAAHNTVSVDGNSQAETSGTFAWRKRVSSRGTVATLRPQGRMPALELSWLEGEHDSYTPQGVTHRRSVLSLPGDYSIVVDRFAGRSEHVLDFHYHLGPETEPVTIAPRDEGAELRSEVAGFTLAIYGTEPLRVTLHSGETSPIAGWASRSYGEKHPVPLFRAAMPTPDLRHGGVGALTFIATGAARPVINRIPLESGRGVACTFERDGIRDLAVFTPDGNETHVAGLHTKGDFFWMRTESGAIRAAAAIRATDFEYKQINLLEEPLCARFAAS